MHHRGLADARVAAHQDELRTAVAGNALEALAQGGRVHVSPIQALGQLEAWRVVMETGHEVLAQPPAQALAAPLQIES
jgi:hypothetical protein